MAPGARDYYEVGTGMSQPTFMVESPNAPGGAMDIRQVPRSGTHHGCPTCQGEPWAGQVMGCVTLRDAKWDESWMRCRVECMVDETRV